MRLAVHQQIRLLYGAAMLILLAIGGVGYVSTRQVTATAARAEQAQAVLDTLRDLVDLAIVAENAHRGHLITGRESYPDELAASLTRIDTVSRALRRLIGHEAVELAELQSLDEQLAEQRAFLSNPSRRPAANGLGGARDRALTDRGQDLVDRIRDAAGHIAESQHALLREQRDETNVRLGISMLVLGLSFLAAFALTIVATFRVEREMAERRAAELNALQARELAEAASRTKSDFLASMSHELRTPLNSIIGFANVLLKNRNGSLAEQELLYLQRIRDNGTHQLHLIDDLLDLSAIEAGKQRLTISSVSLEELIRETVGQLEGRLTSKEVVLRVDLPTRMLPVDTDARKLKQVLINLVGNALKFTPVGSVRVSVHVSPTSLRPRRIEVTDTGVGIPASRLDAIFEPFEQVETGSGGSGGQQGTGLGLAIARSLCELMGYRLSVKSEVGKGSTFSIDLESVSVSGPHATTGPTASQPQPPAEAVTA
ncbi:MAG: sensor histidine kinase [Gemmatimonadaceae bacterium]